ncbi:MULTISPECIES: hypothetical protein [unclassified Gilliamella]|uniref:hypothetical protein n=1 Tax=unclassified Gilliamella TaxID=2685620 RepID=UPI002269E1E4|nr:MULTISPECIES: hypothetical protein [unclassified Gilliamella]MCX8602419.1 hypothetical protein [Gilliamella sp. B3722]MCX8611826.1 hypothetical protein [Gilliamella sp. B3891]MCX8614055.1 hypothetical protein [Gilliamella sp. B3773]MCX8615476.1 hypothetical protein [Gilliamella sp. B3770]MCX8621323.1 hypothetical protein [Gilliamella sp. B3892]
MNDYPLEQKTVQLGAYSRQQKAQFSTVETRSGKLYFKRIAQEQPILRNISFVLLDYEAQIFLDWFNNVLKRGFLPFDIKLATEWDSSQTLNCRFLPDSLLNTTRNNHLQWSYSAKILINNYGPPDYIPLDIIDHQNYYSNKARSQLDQIINVNMKNIG